MFRPSSSSRPEYDVAARAADFVSNCRASAPDLEAARLREGHALLATISEMLGTPASLPSRRVIDAMIEISAYDGAALALIGRDRPFVLSRGGGGGCLATLIVERTGTEVSAEGASPALALLAAAALAWSEELRAPPRNRARFYTPFARVH